jgi:5-methylcytosine-specific restriction endonuclease McrA
MFSRDEVWRAWQRQGCVCNHCHRAIPFDLVHGDHMVPWSQGGPTTMANLQALCGSCNLRKGTNPQEIALARFDVELRRWAPASLAARGHASRAFGHRA